MNVTKPPSPLSLIGLALMHLEPQPESEERLAEGTLISHLVELRARILKALLGVLVVFLCLAPFSEQVFTLLSNPLAERLPEGSTMIATGVAAPFFVPFKATIYAALFLAMPFVLYQAWQFAAPALYRHEKRITVPLLVSSVALFYTGVAFAYFLVIELTFGFFVSMTPENVAATPDIGLYLTFVLNVFLAFGAAFEVPVVTFVLVWTGIVSRKTLRGVRPYVFLGAFVVGMLLTPQDVFSQSLLAIPMYLLYEAGLLLARILLPNAESPD